MDGLVLDRDRDFQAIFLDHAGDGPPLVLEGKAAALWGGSVGWPPFTAIVQGPAGGRFIVPAAAGLRRILAKHSFLKTITVPAGSFRGQDITLTTVGSWSFIMTRPTLPDDTAYRVAKALHQGEAALGRRLLQGRETTANNTVAAAPDLSCQSARCGSWVSVHRRHHEEWFHSRIAEDHGREGPRGQAGPGVVEIARIGHVLGIAEE